MADVPLSGVETTTVENNLGPLSGGNELKRRRSTELCSEIVPENDVPGSASKLTNVPDSLTFPPFFSRQEVEEEWTNRKAEIIASFPLPSQIPLNSKFEALWAESKELYGHLSNGWADFLRGSLNLDEFDERDEERKREAKGVRGIIASAMSQNWGTSRNTGGFKSPSGIFSTSSLPPFLSLSLPNSSSSSPFSSSASPSPPPSESLPSYSPDEMERESKGGTRGRELSKSGLSRTVSFYNYQYSVNVLKYRLKGALEAAREETMKLYGSEEFTKLIDGWKEDLRKAWEGERKVLAVVLVTNASRLLGLSSNSSIFAVLFVKISEVLDLFGNLLYSDLKELTQDGTQSALVARSIFGSLAQKVEVVSAVVPRIFLSLSLLPSFLLFSPLSAPLLRMQTISSSLRGIGDPFVGAYARAYLGWKRLEIAAIKKDGGAPDLVEYLQKSRSVLVESLEDFLRLFRRFLSGELRAFEISKKSSLRFWMRVLQSALNFLVFCTLCKITASTLFDFLERLSIQFSPPSPPFLLLPPSLTSSSNAPVKRSHLATSTSEPPRVKKEGGADVPSFMRLGPLLSSAIFAIIKEVDINLLKFCENGGSNPENNGTETAGEKAVGTLGEGEREEKRGGEADAGMAQVGESEATGAFWQSANDDKQTDVSSSSSALPSSAVPFPASPSSSLSRSLPTLLLPPPSFSPCPSSSSLNSPSPFTTFSSHFSSGFSPPPLSLSLIFLLCQLTHQARDTASLQPACFSLLLSRLTSLKAKSKVSREKSVRSFPAPFSPSPRPSLSLSSRENSTEFYANVIVDAVHKSVCNSAVFSSLIKVEESMVAFCVTYSNAAKLHEFTTFLVDKFIQEKEETAKAEKDERVSTHLEGLLLHLVKYLSTSGELTRGGRILEDFVSLLGALKRQENKTRVCTALLLEINNSQLNVSEPLPLSTIMGAAKFLHDSFSYFDVGNQAQVSAEKYTVGFLKKVKLQQEELLSFLASCRSAFFLYERLQETVVFLAINLAREVSRELTSLKTRQNTRPETTSSSTKSAKNPLPISNPPSAASLSSALTPSSPSSPSLLTLSLAAMKEKNSSVKKRTNIADGTDRTDITNRMESLGGVDGTIRANAEVGRTPDKALDLSESKGDVKEGDEEQEGEEEKTFFLSIMAFVSASLPSLEFSDISLNLYLDAAECAVDTDLPFSAWNIYSEMVNFFHSKYSSNEVRETEEKKIRETGFHGFFSRALVLAGKLTAPPDEAPFSAFALLWSKFDSFPWTNAQLCKADFSVQVISAVEKRVELFNKANKLSKAYMASATFDETVLLSSQSSLLLPPCSSSLPTNSAATAVF